MVDRFSCVGVCASVSPCMFAGLDYGACLGDSPFVLWPMVVCGSIAYTSSYLHNCRLEEAFGNPASYWIVSVFVISVCNACILYRRRISLLWSKLRIEKEPVGGG